MAPKVSHRLINGRVGIKHRSQALRIIPTLTAHYLFLGWILAMERRAGIPWGLSLGPWLGTVFWGLIYTGKQVFLTVTPVMLQVCQYPGFPDAHRSPPPGHEVDGWKWDMSLSTVWAPGYYFCPRKWAGMAQLFLRSCRRGSAQWKLTHTQKALVVEPQRWRLESWLLPLSAMWSSAVTSILSTLHGLIEKDEAWDSKKGSPARKEEN